MYIIYTSESSLKIQLTDDSCFFQDMQTRIVPIAFFYVFLFVVTRLIMDVVPLCLVKDGQRHAARRTTKPVYFDTQLRQLALSDVPCFLGSVLYPRPKVRCIYTSTICGGRGCGRASNTGGRRE